MLWMYEGKKVFKHEYRIIKVGEINRIGTVKKENYYFQARWILWNKIPLWWEDMSPIFKSFKEAKEYMDDFIKENSFDSQFNVVIMATTSIVRKK